MWEHGIDEFLQILSRSLPGSLDHMLSFMFDTSSMLSLMHQTVRTFDGSEFLGDLASLFMWIQKEYRTTNNNWDAVARFWYKKVVNNTPNQGNLYYHLGLLARSFSLEQFSCYAISSTCTTPLPESEKDMETFFQPFMIEGGLRSTSFWSNAILRCFLCQTLRFHLILRIFSALQLLNSGPQRFCLLDG